MFGPRYMATLMGIVFFSHQVGSFLGVWLGGRLYDQTGSYDVVWWLSRRTRRLRGHRALADPGAARRPASCRPEACHAPCSGPISSEPRRLHVRRRTKTFKALLVSRDEAKKQSVGFVDMRVDDLMEGDVLVRVSHSTVNYKDGLAITGKLPVVRRWPMIPGIDFSGDGRDLREARTSGPATR